MLLEDLIGKTLTRDESEFIFLSKEDILNLIDEKTLFQWIGFIEPTVGERIVSPFREDRNPNCWFETDLEGNLRFVDFGNPNIINGIKMFNIDCFHAVQVHFGLETLQQTLLFIKKAIDDNKLPQSNIKKQFIKQQKAETLIHFKSRTFNSNDKEFWSSYHISKSNLIEDRVYAVEWFKITKIEENTLTYPHDICYIYTDFDCNHKKIYRPHKPKKRFITNCTRNDIGSVKNLKNSSNTLYITKSYKDCRVLTNIGLETIWFQNEGMFPDDEILYPLIKNYKKVTVFFDNDKTGILASNNLVQKLLQLGIKANSIQIPNQMYKDPAELIKQRNTEELSSLIKNLN
jgi:hypothetical protein